ncbi:MAG: hypothetical protein NUW37_10160 [Planctomycetes bacterium]|nr:hypothetical protein [Planctomycetota bacterium]
MKINLWNKTERFFKLKMKGIHKLSGEKVEMEVNVFVGGYCDIGSFEEKYRDFELTMIEGEPPPPVH